MTSVSAAQTGTGERELIAAETTSDDDRWQTTSLTSLTFPSASPVPLTSCQLPRTPRRTTRLQEWPNSVNSLIRVAEYASYHMSRRTSASLLLINCKIARGNESVIIRLTDKYFDVSRSSEAYLNRRNSLWSIAINYFRRRKFLNVDYTKTSIFMYYYNIRDLKFFPVLYFIDLNILIYH